jgi:DNA polymerase elongation subunit (family B)
VTAAGYCSVCAWQDRYGTVISPEDSYRKSAEISGTSKDSVMRHFRHLTADNYEKALVSGEPVFDKTATARILAFDLETSPILGYFWGIWQQNIAPSQVEQWTEVICFGARWVGEDEVIFRSVHHDGKEAMLKKLWELFDEADAVMGWNSAGFDSKHVKREFLEAGLNPPSPWKELDLMRSVKREFRFASNKLNSVSEILGVGKKTPHTGFEMWQKCMAGDDEAWDLMREYQIQDVNLLLDLHEKLLPWIKDHPRVGAEDGKLRCKNCGHDQLEPAKDKNGNDKLHRAPTRSYVLLECQKCHFWNKETRSVYTAGITNAG